MATRNVIKKQATKAMMEKGVGKRLVDGSMPQGYMVANEVTNAISSAIFSAISQGYDKVRLSDDLHLRVKVVKGGRVRAFGMAGGNGGVRQTIQLPDRVVVTLCATPAFDAACKSYLKSINHTEDGQPAPAPSNGTAAYTNSYTLPKLP